jgi:hypothetical protein
MTAYALTSLQPVAPLQIKFTDEFLTHMVNTPRQYDATCCALALEVIRLRAQIKQERKEHQEDLRDASRSASDEATWKHVQGDDYGSF